jgi:hypothetical protein
MQDTWVLEDIPVLAVYLIIGVGSALIGVLLGFLVAYLASRSVQRREWRKRDLQKTKEDVEVLGSCVLAVKQEIQHNHDLLLRKHEDYVAGSWDPALFQLSTVSFQSCWPVFVQKGFILKEEERFRPVSRLLHEYVRVNQILEHLRNVIMTERRITDATKVPLAAITRETWQKNLKGKAVKALDEMAAELANRKEELGRL